MGINESLTQKTFTQNEIFNFCQANEESNADTKVVAKLQLETGFR